MRRAVIALGILVGAGPGTGTAAAHRPAGPGAKALADLGVLVDWPLPVADSQVLPGARLRVRVRRVGAHGPRRGLRLALLRVSRQSGTPLGTVAARRFMSGTVTLRVPRGEGRYALALDVGSRRYQSLVTATPLAVCRAGPTGPATASATLELAQRTVAPGGQVSAVLTNAGPGCLSTGVDWALDRQGTDGSWTALPGPVFTLQLLSFGPGQTMAVAAAVPADAAPGRYRLRKDVLLGRGSAPQDLTAEFDVVAPGG